MSNYGLDLFSSEYKKAGKNLPAFLDFYWLF